MELHRTCPLSFHTHRIEAFKTWENLHSGWEQIGKGKYGTVYSIGDAYVLKRSSTSRQRGHMCRQAFREHVIGILQTIAVLEGCTPHLPIHYAVRIGVNDKSMRGDMYMEKFSGSLHDFSGACLRNSSEWICLAFSILHSCITLAHLYGICHNDLYPRNVLISPKVQLTSVVYLCDNVLYDLDWPFFAAVTDFGVSTSSILMGEQMFPEVMKGQAHCIASPNFGRKPPENHILKYKNLPIFSRDLYTVLKWFKYSSSLPAPPPSIQQWATISLELLDNTSHRLHTFEGTMRIFNQIFSNEWMSLCNLKSIQADAKFKNDDAHFQIPPPASKMANIMQKATEALHGIPLTSMSEI